MVKNKLQFSQNQYNLRTWNRAVRALACSPFTLKLFTAMQNDSVPLSTMALNQGKTNQYTQKAIAENKVESYLLWLINVGLLRREVDGQGLTDSFRLTPLGREIISHWEVNNQIPRPSWLDQIRNWFNRWLAIFI